VQNSLPCRSPAAGQEGERPVFRYFYKASDSRLRYGHHTFVCGGHTKVLRIHHKDSIGFACLSAGTGSQRRKGARKIHGGDSKWYLAHPSWQDNAPTKILDGSRQQPLT
jgi:hypothetical protein